LWASGLFRYLTDETILNIVKDIERKYKKFGMNTKMQYDNGVRNCEDLMEIDYP